MTPPDDELRSILHDAVSDVHPDPALERIRRRVEPVAAVRRERPWLAMAAAATAVTAIVGGIALLNRPDAPAPASGQSTGITTLSPTAQPTPGSLGERALALYYVGDSPHGPRLYREFRRMRVPTAGPPVFAAVDQALQQADDPDYRSPWPTGTYVGQDEVSPDGRVTISVSNASTDLRQRPAGMSDAEATAAIQQLVYTAQAAVGNRNPVRIQLDGKDTPSLLGTDVSRPVAQLGQLDILALVSISDPAEGSVVRGSFTARGEASSFEATVPWQITKDGAVVKKGFSTAGGWLDKLYPWKTDPIDVSRLAPGTYIFTASTADPSSGEGAGPDRDTRTIVVRR
ncbi:MAG: GerMN domain-containing protein [Actinomycetota bacterium]|nr:GerMN domain-containing protein [Actinomycetota bacterium]